MTVNICGIPHKVILKKDSFDVDCHMGQINYKDATILINEDMNDAMKREALCHEMVHGMLMHLGYNELTNDETFVQCLGNAICQGFEIKVGFDKMESEE